jgi:hypothetical protein
VNLTTIQIPEDEAKARLAEYTQALKTERNTEDEAIASAYRAASRGLPIIQLSKAIQEGGWFENGLPRIAIIRANAIECFVSVHHDHLVYADRRRPDNRGAKVGQHTVLVPITPRPVYQWASGRTVVPLIPPRHRPKRYRIRNFHILWEVEAWTLVPPKDPALLRHIRGDLWSVLATWELTELEQAILGVRL